MFDKSILPVEKVACRVISIGNLTVGGSGKTPTVLMVSKLLKETGTKVGVLSRGYKRSSKGYLLVSDGKNIFANVDDAGDEILLIAKENKIPAAVCEKRVIGAGKFLNDVNLDVIILDDAYQHRWLYRDLDILLIDQRFLHKVNSLEQSLLPLGNMREPFSSISRADLIIINTKFSDKQPVPSQLLPFFENKNVVWANYVPAGILDVKNEEIFTLKDFEGLKGLVVSGIARPYSFLKILEDNNIDISNKILFKDHKNYDLNDVNDIRKKFYDTNSHFIITTQKDAIKLSKFSVELDDVDIYYLKIEMIIEDQNFEKILINTLNNNKNNNGMLN